MKTRISQIVAIAFFALFILVGNVNAEGTEKSASSHENIEATLELENWMVNDKLWDTGNSMTIENEEDETLELEDWMTAKSTWELGATFKFKTETETELAFEPWMTNENIWK